MQTKDHVKAMEGHLAVRLSDDDVAAIHAASPLNPLFPMDFLFGGLGAHQQFHLGLTAQDNPQYQMAARFENPPKQKYR